ncbi:hypothetical protein K440DRAFT_645377 [Wilcoxina mikolae CBS 423.85]|nr:hypothetical protein K440DRAFT_645377 [Wilcoxina mikolae CBS 423.85]
MSSTDSSPSLVNLPPELFDRILTKCDLQLEDTIRVSFTCCGIYNYTTPMIQKFISGMSYEKALEHVVRILREQPHGDPFKHRARIAILNIVVNNPHVRNLVENRAETLWKEQWGEFDGDGIWADVFSTRWIGYDGFPVHVIEEEGTNFKEAEIFLKEFHRADVPAQLAIDQKDASALIILGKNGWAIMPECVNRAVSATLDNSGSPQAMKTFEAALRIGLYRPCWCRKLFLLSDKWLVKFLDIETDDQRYTNVTAFELCSRQPPDCHVAAAVLKMLLTALRQGDYTGRNEDWPRYAVVYLREAFLVALETAIQVGVRVRLRVLEMWLECCESILVPNGHFHWRAALELRHAELLREVLCVKARWPTGHVVPPINNDRGFPDLRGESMSAEWELKTELAEHLAIWHGSPKFLNL